MHFPRTWTTDFCETTKYFNGSDEKTKYFSEFSISALGVFNVAKFVNKLVLKLIQEKEFLKLIINTLTLTLSLSEEKLQRLRVNAEIFYHKPKKPY